MIGGSLVALVGVELYSGSGILLSILSAACAISIDGSNIYLSKKRECFWPENGKQEKNYYIYTQRITMETIKSKRILHSKIKEVLESKPTDSLDFPQVLNFCEGMG